MARPHDLLRWLYEAGHIDRRIELHPADGFRDRTFHVNPTCRHHGNPETAVTVNVDELDALIGPGNNLCLWCAPNVLDERHPAAVRDAHHTLRQLTLLCELDDTKRVPHADRLPALMAERRHQVLDRIRRNLGRGHHHGTSGDQTVGATLSDQLGAIVDSDAKATPRPNREQVMTEALRLAAVFNAARQVGYPHPAITDAAIGGEEPSEILARVIDEKDLAKTSALIDEIERRIVESKPAFVLVQCYPDVFYQPLTSLLEVAVVASARYFGHHRVIGELPDEICESFPRRRHQDSRGPRPERLDVAWEPVTDDVLETAVQLWKISGIDEPWSDLNGAMETAIALG